MAKEETTQLAHCEACDGTGAKDGETCAKCEGSGRVEAPKPRAAERKEK